MHATLAGATKIDAFDINQLAKYYAALKIAMVRTYDLKNFMNQFEEYNPYYTLPPKIKPSIDLSEIKPMLTDEQFIFWKLLLNNGDVTFDNLFKKDGYKSTIYGCCDYLDEQKYELLKNKLDNTIITFKDLDITEEIECREQLLDTYDAMFLSNIREYYAETVLYDNINSLLNPNGILYDYHCRSPLSTSDMNDLKFKNLARLNKHNNNVGVVMYQKSR